MLKVHQSVSFNKLKLGLVAWQCKHVVQYAVFCTPREFFFIIIMNYVTPLRWHKKRKQSQYLQSVIIHNIMIYDPVVFVHICSWNTENGGKSHKDLLLGSNKIHSEWKLASCINSCTLKITFYSGLSRQFDVLSKVCIIFFIIFFFVRKGGRLKAQIQYDTIDLVFEMCWLTLVASPDARRRSIRDPYVLCFLFSTEL